MHDHTGNLQEKVIDNFNVGEGATRYGYVRKSKNLQRRTLNQSVQLDPKNWKEFCELSKPPHQKSRQGLSNMSKLNQDSQRELKILRSQMYGVISKPYDIKDFKNIVNKTFDKIENQDEKESPRYNFSPNLRHKNLQEQKINEENLIKVRRQRKLKKSINYIYC